MSGTLNRSADTDVLSPAPVHEGQTIADKYLVGKVLGIGGMGVVVLATDTLLERRVAMKFLLSSLASSEKAVQRFMREARLATRITSEHVVKLLEIDTLPSGVPFFAMEYLEGRDLRDMLADRGPLPVAEVVDYVLQALQAIAEGHQCGIIHRDLKPSNLFVTHRADGTPLVKVLDFGIAKISEMEKGDAALTGSGDTRLGSPSYMSPEQLQNPSEVDARSDVWALGVTLYELICGSPPFEGKTYADLVLAITSSHPPPPRRLRPDLSLPRGLDQVIMRCIARDRSLRFGSALELAIALAPFGTDDAQASLRRVKGIVAPAVPPGPSTPRRDSPRPELMSSTVPLSGRTDSGRTRRSPVVPVVAPRRAARALALPLGIGIMLVAWFALAWFVWLRDPGTNVPPPLAGRAEPEPVKAEPESVAKAEPPPSVPAAGTPPARPVIEPALPAVAAPKATAANGAVTVTPQPREREVASELAPTAPTSRPLASAGAVPAPAPEASAGLTPGPNAGAVIEPVAGAAPLPSGRSPAIERLIQERR